MKRKGFDSRLAEFGRAGARLMQGCALALVVALALPVRAADERAVRVKVAPVYPEIAKRMRIGGVVQVEVTVDADGRVSEAKAVGGNHMLGTAAEDAVRKWKFEPGSSQSKVTVQINFTLTE